ncbi:hypothetical protein GJ496_004193 [Pomphorhynchus laevis]|nr:hypothetical protein GJ496_004193 [Pomphorhynchus laevis]
MDPNSNPAFNQSVNPNLNMNRRISLNTLPPYSTPIDDLNKLELVNRLQYSLNHCSSKLSDLISHVRIFCGQNQLGRRSPNLFSDNMQKQKDYVSILNAKADDMILTINKIQAEQSVADDNAINFADTNDGEKCKNDITRITALQREKEILEEVCKEQLQQIGIYKDALRGLIMEIDKLLSNI